MNRVLSVENHRSGYMLEILARCAMSADALCSAATSTFGKTVLVPRRREDGKVQVIGIGDFAWFSACSSAWLENR